MGSSPAKRAFWRVRSRLWVVCGLGLVGGGAGCTHRANKHATPDAAADAAAMASASGTDADVTAPTATGFSPRAVIAGLCNVQRVLAARGRPIGCPGRESLEDCSARNCGLDSCVATCPRYIQCLVAASDACEVDQLCVPEDACITCLSQVQSCGLIQQCANTYACAVPTPGGLCSKLEACCAAQRNPDFARACVAWVKQAETVAGDEGCTEVTRNGFATKLATDPPCVLDAGSQP